MKFVIFDIDGTLTDTKNVDDKCFIEAFEQTFDINIEHINWESITHVTDWGITEEIIERELKRKPYQEEYQTMISNFLYLLQQEKNKDFSQFGAVEGAVSFFNRLRVEDGIKLGIATGGWAKPALLKLSTIGLDSRDVCFSNSSFYKSREEITKDVIHQLCAKTQNKPTKITYFGDGLWDYNTCQNLGIDFIGIDVNGNRKLKNLGVQSVFKDFTSMDQLMQLI
ncbi:MAG: HAD hydrolase-like protein [Saprospiraceae bacterium]|nr:HAD hydrolase-like protein [Saprospiraceae bacterium]